MLRFEFCTVLYDYSFNFKTIANWLFSKDELTNSNPCAILSNVLSRNFMLIRWKSVMSREHKSEHSGKKRNTLKHTNNEPEPFKFTRLNDFHFRIEDVMKNGKQIQCIFYDSLIVTFTCEAICLELQIDTDQSILHLHNPLLKGSPFTFFWITLYIWLCIYSGWKTAVINPHSSLSNCIYCLLWLREIEHYKLCYSSSVMANKFNWLNGKFTCFVSTYM